MAHASASWGGRRPWGSPQKLLRAGQLVRMPDHRVFVVDYVNASRARIYPLTPRTRIINVKDRSNVHTEKEINETGNPIDIAPTSGLDSVEVDELTDLEFARLVQFVTNGGDFDV